MNRQSWAARMDRISKWMIVTVLLLIVLLLLSQLALQFHVVREWVTGVDRLEGIPISY